MQRKFQGFKLSVKFQDRRLSSTTICFGYYELNKKKSAHVKARDNTFVFVFLHLSHHLCMQIYPPQHQFTSRSIMFSSFALYRRAAQSGIKEIQYLCGRDLAAFCSLAGWGLRGTLGMHLIPYDGFGVADQECNIVLTRWRRYNAIHISVTYHTWAIVNHDRGQRDFRLYCCFQMRAILLCTHKNITVAILGRSPG